MFTVGFFPELRWTTRGIVPWWKPVRTLNLDEVLAIGKRRGEGLRDTLATELTELTKF
jgi:hypothetical protein